MKSKIFGLLAAIAIGAATLAPASAIDVPKTIQVTASISTACAFSTNPAPTSVFGTIAGTAAGETGPFVVSNPFAITCSLGAPYSLTFDGGSDWANNTSSMLGTNTGAHLAYNVYQDAGGSNLWNTGQQAVSATGTNAAQSYTAYFKIITPITAPPDTYADTENLTLSY